MTPNVSQDLYSMYQLGINCKARWRDKCSLHTTEARLTAQLLLYDSHLCEESFLEIWRNHLQQLPGD